MILYDIHTGNVLKGLERPCRMIKDRPLCHDSCRNLASLARMKGH